jgi:hypothetical protein
MKLYVLTEVMKDDLGDSEVVGIHSTESGAIDYCISKGFTRKEEIERISWGPAVAYIAMCLPKGSKNDDSYFRIQCFTLKV